MLEMKEEGFVSKDNYLTESEWKIIPYLLELLKPFIQTDTAEAHRRSVRHNRHNQLSSRFYQAIMVTLS
jgi:hypothetical protein